MTFASGKPYRGDGKKKRKLRLSLCIHEVEVDVPEVLDPVKAANEAAKMDRIEAAARAKIADFTSRDTAPASAMGTPPSAAPPASAPVANPEASPTSAASAPPTPA